MSVAAANGLPRISPAPPRAAGERPADEAERPRTAPERAGKPGVAVSVVIPVRDEVESLDELLAGLDRLARPLELETIVVDDGSRDGSLERLIAARSRYSWLRVVELRRPYGKSVALGTGFELARGPIVVIADADLQDDLTAVPALVAEVREGRANLAVGRRVERKDGIGKRLPSAVFNWLVRRVGWVPFRDVNSGLKALRRDVALACDLYGERHRLIPLVAALDGYRVVEVPVGHAPRRHGRSKYGGSRFMRGLLDLMTIAFLARYDLSPAYFFGGAGLLSGAAGAAILTYLAVLRIALGTIQFRYPLLALGVLLVAVGFQLVTAGFLAELLVTCSRPRRDRTAVRRVVE